MGIGISLYVHCLVQFSCFVYVSRKSQFTSSPGIVSPYHPHWAVSLKIQRKWERNRNFLSMNNLCQLYAWFVCCFFLSSRFGSLSIAISFSIESAECHIWEKHSHIHSNKNTNNSPFSVSNVDRHDVGMDKSRKKKRIGESVELIWYVTNSIESSTVQYGVLFYYYTKGDCWFSGKPKMNVVVTCMW